MSDNKNHKKAIQAIIEAHRTPGKMREIWLQILDDKPSAIVNAWEVVKPSRQVFASEYSSAVPIGHYSRSPSIIKQG